MNFRPRRDPGRAIVAGVRTAAGHLTAAVTVVADAVVTGLRNIRAAVDESRVTSQAPTPDAATPVHAAQKPPRRAATAATRDVTANALSDSDVRSAPAITEPSTRRTVAAAERDDTRAGSTRKRRTVALNPRHTLRSLAEKAAERRDRAASRRSDSAAEHPGVCGRRTPRPDCGACGYAERHG